MGPRGWTKDGRCEHCGLEPEPHGDELHHYSGVDPCLGILPDVVQACCGHGRDGKEPYVVIAPGNKPGTGLPALKPGTYRGALYGSFALSYFAALGVGPQTA